MNYTPEMATAFRAIEAPKNFGVVLYENDDFITIQIDPKELLDITEQQGIEIAKYINEVKHTLESFGAVVFIVRDAIGEDND